MIFSASYWDTNSALIRDCANLGYLRSNALTLDATYGLGNFWQEWKPDRLVTLDLHTPSTIRGDFTTLPFAKYTFGSVVYDPPYKLNGTPSEPDRAYGVHVYTRWQDRMSLIERGLREAIRVSHGTVLAKCMDQVVSGAVRWQTDILSAIAQEEGIRKLDRLDFLTNPREQPHIGQKHARRNYSTLLVFGW